MLAGFRPKLSRINVSHLPEPLAQHLVSQAAFISIPVRAHVRQFLLQEFGPDPHQVHQKTYIGQQVLMVAEKLPYRLERLPAPLPVRESYRIQLPKALKHQSITELNLRQLGKSLEKYFQDCMVVFVKGAVCFTGNERAAVRKFFELYNISPDDYDMELGRKQYRDYKDKVLKDNGQLLAMQLQPTTRFASV